MLGGFHALRGVIDSVNKLLSVQGSIPVDEAHKQAMLTPTFIYLSRICPALAQSPFITPLGARALENTQSINTQKTHSITVTGVYFRTYVPPCSSSAFQSSHIYIAFHNARDKKCLGLLYSPLSKFWWKIQLRQTVFFIHGRQNCLCV